MSDVGSARVPELLRACLLAAAASLGSVPSGIEGPEPLAAQLHSFRAADGEIVITPFAGASAQLEYRGVVIHVDPWSRGDYAAAKPADLILITDTPTDHLDPALIERLRTPGTVVVVPIEPERARDAGGADRLRDVEPTQLMRNGERRDFLLRGIEATVGADGRVGAAGIAVTVEAIPMYDIIPGEPFHAAGEGNGYVVTLGGVRIYFAGVTECTPEMRAVRDIDIAFVPMNLPNGRMPPAVAAECVRAIGPRVVYPYHYRELPIDAFVEALRGSPIEVRLHDWYPRS
jgi:L-ascorbate metabolism protein UlaG (beta-lactamase superfamily)